MNKNVIATLAIVAAAFAGCSSTPTFQTGEDAEVTFDTLTRMDNTVMDVVWALTDIDLTEYRKVKFEGIGVEYREVWTLQRPWRFKDTEIEPCVGIQAGRRHEDDVRRGNHRCVPRGNGQE